MKKMIGGLVAWRPLLGLVAVGVVAVSAAAPARSQENRRPRVDARQSLALEGHRPVLRIGPGMPAHIGLRVLPPVKLDYRKDYATEARARGEAVVIGGGRGKRPLGYGDDATVRETRCLKNGDPECEIHIDWA